MTMRGSILAMLSLAVSLAAMPELRASELKEVTPVTDRVVQLYFIDGKAYWDQLGQPLTNRIEAVPLDVAQAENAASYTVRSNDDPAFAAGVQPQQVGRKSKGRDFMYLPQHKLAHQLEHWIYLVLPHPMREGRRYKVIVGGLSSGATELEFTFDSTGTRSEAVHANQVGYVPTAERKQALLSQWMGDLGGLNLDEIAQGSFHVVNARTGQVVYSGKPTLRKRADGPADSGDAVEGTHFRADVWECDFSEVREPGEYVLAMDRMGCSFPFRIDADVYRQAFITTLRGLYHQRCGLELEEPYTSYVRGACHRGPKQQTSVRNMDHDYMDGLAGDKPQPTGESRDVWGGYHDAGDWDREAWHVDDVPTNLTMLYSLAPGRFRDGELNIPESGNGIPDILDEAQWGVDYYRWAQRPDGGVGVGAYSEAGCKAGENSMSDTGNWYLYAEEPKASYGYAAAASHLAVAFERAGRPELGKPYLESARRAYEWAGKNLRDGDDGKCRDERLHASAALYQATGEAAFEQAFKKDLLIATPATPLVEYQQYDQRWGVWTYVLTNRSGMDDALKQRLVQATAHWADTAMIEPAQKRAGRMAYDWWWPLNWGRGSVPDNMGLIVAHAATGERKYLTYQQLNCDHTLGVNPLDMTWVTGVGARSPSEILLIDWWYMGKADPTLGIAIMGPFRYAGKPHGITGPWLPEYLQASAYPEAQEWPPLELWFNARVCGTTNEFTVGTISTTAAAFGYLCADQGRGQEVTSQ
jgi:hypothetical protein